MLTHLRLYHQLGDCQVAGGAGIQTDGLDVVSHREVFQFVAAYALQTYAEDGKVVYLHVLAVEQKFLDTRHHIGEHALDGTSRVRRVVDSHMFDELLDVDDLIGYGTTIILLETW